MDVLGVTDRQTRSQLRHRAEEARKRGLWSAVSTQGFSDFLWGEDKATEIDGYHISNFPGPLQAPELAEVLIRHGERGSSEADIENYIEIRLARSDILVKPNAPTARFLLYEGILRQRLRIVTRDIYAAQFRYLREVAEYANVEIRYLPINTDCPTVTEVTAGFTVMKLPAGWPTLVHVETPIGPVIGDSGGIDLRSALDAFDFLWDEGAQDAEQTNRLLEELLREVEQ